VLVYDEEIYRRQVVRGVIAYYNVETEMAFEECGLLPVDFKGYLFVACIEYTGSGRNH